MRGWQVRGRNGKDSDQWQKRGGLPVSLQLGTLSNTLRFLLPVFQRWWH